MLHWPCEIAIAYHVTMNPSQKMTNGMRTIHLGPHHRRNMRSSFGFSSTRILFGNTTVGLKIASLGGCGNISAKLKTQLHRGHFAIARSMLISEAGISAPQDLQV